MSKLPRRGLYEIFTHLGDTHCFDDPECPVFKAPAEMFEWLREQPVEECRPMDSTNVAFYLTPRIYLLWKLKWT